MFCHKIELLSEKPLLFMVRNINVNLIMKIFSDGILMSFKPYEIAGVQRLEAKVEKEYSEQTNDAISSAPLILFLISFLFGGFVIQLVVERTRNFKHQVILCTWICFFSPICAVEHHFCYVRLVIFFSSF